MMFFLTINPLAEPQVVESKVSEALECARAAPPLIISSNIIFSNKKTKKNKGIPNIRRGVRRGLVISNYGRGNRWGGLGVSPGTDVGTTTAQRWMLYKVLGFGQHLGTIVFYFAQHSVLLRTQRYTVRTYVIPYCAPITLSMMRAIRKCQHSTMLILYILTAT